MSERVDPPTVLAGLGVATVGAAVLLIAAPGVARSLGVEALANTRSLAEGSNRAFWLVVVGLCCLAWVARTADAATADAALPDHSLQSSGDVPVPTVGRGFDAAVEAAADAAAEGDDHDDARETLRSLAIDVVAYTDDCSRDEAAERVRSGSWTDDPVAGSYLADLERPPLRWRLRAWFRPRRTTVRRVERTVAAIEARMGVEGRR